MVKLHKPRWLQKLQLPAPLFVRLNLVNTEGTTLISLTFLVIFTITLNINVVPETSLIQMTGISIRIAWIEISFNVALWKELSPLPKYRVFSDEEHN